MELLKVGLVSVVCLGATHLDAANPVHWPQFRGVSGSGVADSSTLPTRWSPTSNVAWVAEVPGRGWSSPVVWGDRVFLTSAVNAGAFKAPSTGIFGNDYAEELSKQGLPDDEVLKRLVARDIELASESKDVSYQVLALDARTGKVVWQREAHRGRPGGRHRKNTYASETPATDGERLYASFGGNVGLFCYSLEGTLLWKRTWQPQPIYLDFGTASSPVVHRGRVYQLHDNEGESFLAALDAQTGDLVWTVRRTANEGRLKSGWATPLVWESGARTEIVTVGRGVVISYDTEGRELWRLKGITQATPTPVVGEGLLFVGSGSQGETTRPMFAIRPGALGDISTDAGKPASEFVSWFLPRFSAYTSSPLYYRGRLYAVNDNGILQVADAKSGKEIFKARVGGGGATFSSSPLASAGRIYLLSEDGDTFVLQAGDGYREIAKNSLGEMSLATPAADADSLYVRTQTKLYRMRAPETAARPGVIAHRGVSGEAPENTLPAIGKAIELGCALAEIDLRYTADGEIVLMHDATVDRTTNGRGRVAEKTFAELQRLDAGGKAEFRGTRIPTLREVVERARGHIELYLDLKEADPRPVVRLVEELGARSMVVYRPYSHLAAQQILAAAPSSRLLIDVGDWLQTPQLIDTLRRGFPTASLSSDWPNWTPAAVAAARSQGMTTFVNVLGSHDTPDNLREAVAQGFDYIQTDHPRELLAILREQAPPAVASSSPR